MNKILILSLFAMVAFCAPGGNQNIAKDKKLMQVIDSLPSNWYFEYTDSMLTLRCKDSVYQIWTNHINEEGHFGKPTVTEEEKMEKFRKEGMKKVAVFLSFKLVTPWSDARIKKTSAHNQKIYNDMKELPKKHKIDHLYNNFASHKGTPTYTAKTDDDQKRIDAFTAEEEDLESQIIRFPEYCTANFAVFNRNSIGMNSAYQDIYPARISEQAYHIVNLVSEYWDCNTK
ncbi:MAG: hypothetical protein ACHQF2_11010 [Flavobacteriales bacterium]